ncbi:prepilin-type N-terminal cleavage/methylation domain-containing protein [Marinicella marina]|uniref:prepilin-type N-terminal cleavage/methylation domain-containing protein n=2 Tax=Marinicella marina TaxID=2996016 RepID=UPI002260E51C|nr:prepilin-type N-terminal cleavage/methylation domain-containing protein [Marinicella marina]MDJ1140709.1 prepilin-type N-terminal cleavage/methylation domain-containing protein [Marinicella marina]
MMTNKYRINNQKGFSLIELMVALVIGLIILTGMISLFTASSSLNRAQTGLAILQENGRYAISRLKMDFESAGRKHCATLTMPNEFTTKWNQGYEMSAWRVSNNVNFTNGLPARGQIELDTLADPDQLPDTVDISAFNSYPLDPSFFIRGYECASGSCLPALSTPGTDASFVIPAIGTADDSRADNTDIVTVRYLRGGNRVTAIAGNNLTLAEISPFTTGDAVVADCNTSYVTPANWAGNAVNSTTPLPGFNLNGDTRVYNLDEELVNVTYFVGVDQDPSNPSRLISSLYRSENGLVQQLVEGVERFDVFYLAQLQTGHVVRMTADEVQSIQGGGDVDGNGAVDAIQGCIIPPSIDYLGGNVSLANGAGCLWRSIYAMEVHLLLNTVNNSASNETEPYIYSPDGMTPQTPGAALPSGLPAERMYRREFTAIVPVRSYTL